MTTLHFALVAALALGLCTSAMAGSFSIAKEDTCATITLPITPSATESYAASQFAEYVESMTGTKLKVIESNEAPEGAIVLRKSADAQLGDEGYSISLEDGRLVLTGARDRSVLYAVYDLLERLGCRWLAPKFGFYDGRNEVVPKKSSLVIDLPQPIIQKPALKFRKFYVEEGHTHNAENLLQMIEWMSKSRENTLVIPTDYQGHGRVKWDNWRETLTPELRKRDIMIEVGGHGYQNFINAQMPGTQGHDDWFGMRDGKRQKGLGAVFCTSNADAVAFLTKNVVAYLKSHPETDIFDFWPPDGGEWCECEHCAELGTPADRQARLVNSVIAEARKQGIRTRFECIAYSVYTQPPTRPRMDKSVLIDFCPINQCFEVQISDPSSDRNAGYADALREWKKSFDGDISIYSYYRKYAWNSLPVVIPHYMQADMKWYESLGLAGISSYAEPGDWITYELNHYTFARLAWNPNVDVDGLISEFCTARFPECADSARKLYATLEETVRHACGIPYSSHRTPAELATYADRLRTARNTMAQAAGGDASAAGLLAATDYALRDLAIQQQIAAKADKQERAKSVDSLLAFIQSHKGEGVFVDGRLSREHIMKVYGAYE